MKKALLILICLLLISSAFSCGAPAEPQKKLTTVTKSGLPKVTTTFVFDGEDMIKEVSQSVEYGSEATAEAAFKTLGEASDYVTDVKRDGVNVSYSLTPSFIEECYPEGTYASVVAEAEENGLEMIND